MHNAELEAYEYSVYVTANSGRNTASISMGKTGKELMSGGIEEATRDVAEAIRNTFKDIEIDQLQIREQKKFVTTDEAEEVVTEQTNDTYARTINGDVTAKEEQKVEEKVETLLRNAMDKGYFKTP